MIGDPSGKSSERSMLTREQVLSNAAGIRTCVERVLSRLEERSAAEPLDPATRPEAIENGPFYESMSAIDYLRDVGKHFRVSTMLARDSVRTRIESEAGISLTEFAYQTMQAWDFLQLSRTRGCILQAGGSDQWGNIVSGVDLARRVDGVSVYGVTIPLLTTASGAKLGKTEGNAVWLDESKTPAFVLRQYCLNLADEDALSLLYRLTLIPDHECSTIATEHAARPEARLAQRRLADEVLLVSHGPEAVRRANALAAVLYPDALSPGLAGLHAPDAGLSEDELRQELLGAAQSGTVPSVTAPELAGKRVSALLTDAGLCKSRAEGERLVRGGGVRSLSRVVSPDRAVLEAADLVGGHVALLRVGKRQLCVCIQIN
jgi:tyrosyl-tRNA synthetase